MLAEVVVEAGAAQLQRLREDGREALEVEGERGVVREAAQGRGAGLEGLLAQRDGGVSGLLEAALVEQQLDEAARDLGFFGLADEHAERLLEQAAGLADAVLEHLHEAGGEGEVVLVFAVDEGGAQVALDAAIDEQLAGQHAPGSVASSGGPHMPEAPAEELADGSGSLVASVG